MIKIRSLKDCEECLIEVRIWLNSKLSLEEDRIVRKSLFRAFYLVFLAIVVLTKISFLTDEPTTGRIND
jgi:hypothetical protein